VPLDELPNADEFGLRLREDGKRAHDDNTRDIVFGIGKTLQYLSQFGVPEPSTIIAGTPAGVAMCRQPPRYLAEGEQIEVLGQRRQPRCQAVAVPAPVRPR
jgi:2-keto-4-pentenoate hydratase/2-oxohepta-3-ene-1,7-dioic acid hydratase in catechol pathway